MRRTMDDLNKRLGELISDFRLEAELSQEDLAEGAGVHRTYISQLERGLKSPTVRVLLQLCEMLNVPASTLMKSLEETR